MKINEIATQVSEEAELQKFFEEFVTIVLENSASIKPAVFESVETVNEGLLDSLKALGMKAKHFLRALFNKFHGQLHELRRKAAMQINPDAPDTVSNDEIREQFINDPTARGVIKIALRNIAVKLVSTMNPTIALIVLIINDAKGLESITTAMMEFMADLVLSQIKDPSTDSGSMVIPQKKVTSTANDDDMIHHV